MPRSSDGFFPGVSLRCSRFFTSPHHTALGVWSLNTERVLSVRVVPHACAPPQCIHLASSEWPMSSCLAHATHDHQCARPFYMSLPSIPHKVSRSASCWIEPYSSLAQPLPASTSLATHLDLRWPAPSSSPRSALASSMSIFVGKRARALL